MYIFFSDLDEKDEMQKDEMLPFADLWKNWCLLFVVKYIDGINTFLYNLGEKVGDKFTKLCKISFSVQCFTADFLLYCTEKRQNLATGWTAGYSPSNPSISGISGLFLDSFF